MKNRNLRKIAILSALSSMLLTGCQDKTAKNEQLDNSIPIFIEEQTEATTEETQEMISNQTIAKIYEEYKKNTENNVEIDDLLIEKYDKPLYIWNTEGENYIYDFEINNTNNPGYKYIDPGYHGEMYAVIVRKEEGIYEPISALANIDGNIINVKVTYFFGNTVYSPSENYIYIENPTKEDFDNIKNGEQYIKSNNKEPVLSKDVKEYNLLYLKK